VNLGALVIAWLAATASTLAWAYMRSSRRRTHIDTPLLPVLLLRPCAGDEPHLAEALASSRAAPPGSRVRFLVASASDSAAPVAMRAGAELTLAGADARVVVTDARAANRKAAQLAAAVAAEPNAPALIVVADSDVALTRQVMVDLMAPLAAGDAAAAWAPPIETATRTLGDAASGAVLGASLHAFALLSALDPRGMVGKAFALRREALERVGGFDALATVLGEDMELARRLRAAGLRTAVTDRPVVSLAAGRSWRAVTDRYARWLTVLRTQRPTLLAAYPLLLAAAPLQLGLALAGLARGEQHAELVIGAVIALRACTAEIARRRSHVGRCDVLATPWLADVALLLAFGRALWTRKVQWRGIPLRAARGAPLAEDP
jgi:ceramide glucosyltransferase